MRKKLENKLRKICPRCGKNMRFYPGCCGNLPIWRCEFCGQVCKWQEPVRETDKYLTLK